MSMLKLWQAPAGLHIEPADARDTDTIARLDDLIAGREGNG